MKIRPSFYRLLCHTIEQYDAGTPIHAVRCYWQVGHLISKEERLQKCEKRKLNEVLKRLATQLSADAGRKVSFANLQNWRRFYMAFPDPHMLHPELSWAHYLILSRITRPVKRWYYLQQAMDNCWSAGQLGRQIKTLSYERLLAEPPLAVGEHNKQPPTADSLIKSYFIFEFLQLPPDGKHTEKALLGALMENLNAFQQEQGPGFAFVAHQQRISTSSGKQFYVDLVFYHYLLRCFVLIDLKTSELTHGDIGQMDMYIRLFDALWRKPHDESTIGIVLCPKKDPTILQYSSVEDNEQLYALTYKLENKNEK